MLLDLTYKAGFKKVRQELQGLHLLDWEQLEMDLKASSVLAGHIIALSLGVNIEYSWKWKMQR